MITLKDIAREAGVSITTVSNVVHNRKSRVSPELVARIQAIIERENYIPSMTARALASNASPIIGIINHVVSPRVGFLSDPFHNIFMGGIENKSREEGYFLMVRTVEDARGLEAAYRSWNLAGMIFVGLYQDEFFEAVQKTNIPFVLIDSYVGLPDVYNVGLEDKKGGYLATRHLLEKGHRRIAFASPFVRAGGVVEQRLMGYKDALKEFDVSFDPGLVFEQEISVSEGAALGRTLGKRADISAIFASADILAAGIMAGLRSVGVRVPEDKSIVGFDDNYLSQITYPPLSTIHQDADAKGVIATEMIIAQLVGKEVKEKNVILPVRLVERGSVGI